MAAPKFNWHLAPRFALALVALVPKPGLVAAHSWPSALAVAFAFLMVGPSRVCPSCFASALNGRMHLTMSHCPLASRTQESPRWLQPPGHPQWMHGCRTGFRSLGTWLWLGPGIGSGWKERGPGGAQVGRCMSRFGCVCSKSITSVPFTGYLVIAWSGPIWLSMRCQSVL